VVGRHPTSLCNALILSLCCFYVMLWCAPNPYACQNGFTIPASLRTWQDKPSTWRRSRSRSRSRSRERHQNGHKDVQTDRPGRQGNRSLEQLVNGPRSRKWPAQQQRDSTAEAAAFLQEQVSPPNSRPVCMPLGAGPRDRQSSPLLAALCAMSTCCAT